MKNDEKILYVYIYCNLGGVTSVLKQRARHMTSYTLDGLFQIEYGGRAELLKYGFNQILIAEDLGQALKKELAENEYDIVTVIDIPEAAQIVLDSGFRGKLIYEIHTPMTDVLLKNDPATLACVEQIVVPSEWSKDWILRHFPTLDTQRITSCGNIVDPELFQPLQANETQRPPSSDNNSLVWVGKFGDYKNWKQAIEIADQYLQGQPNATAYLVTGGRLTDNIMSEALNAISNTKSAAKILWLHNLSYTEMASLYQRVANTNGVFLSCSSAESFCMVIHEASRCGLPIITTNAGAVAEFIIDNETGLLFDPLDTQSAVTALELAVTNQSTRQKILNGARTKLQSYTPHNLIRDYVSAIS